ncbi:MAG: putative RNA-binding protein (virulence factor B family) [Candidatus Azotimanducaceae bacterium]|jgi:predicted RNA-binding protein (virulence factor B family)
MIDIGNYNTLSILKFEPQGAYLTDDVESVLLPKRYVDSAWKEGHKLEVFVYKDSEDRIVATTERPKITVGQFACLTVSSITPHGAFMDWGLQKDLLVPFSEQERDMVEGREYLVHLYFDYETERLVGSTQLEDFLEHDEIELEEKQEVQITIWRTSDLGYKAIINQKYLGQLYHNEVFQKISEGDMLTGFVQKKREDGKIDLRLQRSGYIMIDEHAQKILEKLKENEGYLPFYDKSDAEEIVREFAMSKKNFKKGIGSLYKQKIISIEEKGIRLKD